jgi:hypothetical protein
MGLETLVPCDFCSKAINTREFAAGTAIVVLQKKYCSECMRKAVERGRPKPITSTPPPRSRRLAIGEHGCGLYSSEDERRGLLVPFVRDGIQKQQKVLYFLEKPSPERILADFRDLVVPVQVYLKNGQLQILSAENVQNAAGQIDPMALLLRITVALDRAIAQGAPGFRVVCDMSWALSQMNDPERLVEFERQLASIVAGGRCTALCQYDVEHFEPGPLHQIRKHHAVVLAKGMARDLIQPQAGSV